MPDATIDELTSGGYLRSSDLIPVERSGSTLKVTALPFDTIRYAPPPSGDTTGATDTAAIQDLIDDAASGNGGTVQLCAGTYYVTGLVGGNMVTIRGSGWRTRVRAVAGITVPVIGTPVSGIIYGCEVRDMCVYGARASTSSDCINFDLSATGQPQYSAVGMPDSVCKVVNCLVLYAGRDGISIGGPDGTRPGSSGGHYIRDCYVIGSGRYGMLLNAFDSLVIGCDVGASKEHGVVISANQTRVIGTKSWYSGRNLYQEGGIDVIGSGASSYDGFFITQPSPSGNNGIQMSGCQSQDNGRYGINFNGVSGVKVSGHMFGGDVVAAFRLGNGNAISLDGMLPQSDRTSTPVLGVCDGNSSGCQLKLHFDSGQATTNLFQFVNGGSFKQCHVEVYSGAGGVNNVGNVSGAQTPSALLARTWVYTFTGNGSIENTRPAVAGQEIQFVVAAGSNTISWGSDYHSIGAALPTTGSFVARFVNVTMNSDTPYWVMTSLLT